MSGFLESELSGWGLYPKTSARTFRPERMSRVGPIVGSPAEPHWLARGLGRSYGDAALNRDGAVLLTQRLDCFLDFDPDSGELVAEPGVSFDQIIELVLPRGWFPPVTPGTKFVTLGGAIACDVHGKNHHQDGSLANHVRWLDLLLADGSEVRCSSQQNGDLFWATTGGMGLTGIILRACLALKKVETAYTRVDYLRTRDLEETLRHLEEEDDQYAYSVAWVDCVARGRKLGRGVLMRGNPCSLAELPAGPAGAPLLVRNRVLASLPFHLPSGLLNRHTCRLMNAIYYRRFKRGHSSALEHYDPYFYPLDMLENWNRGYGKRGFLQHQCVLPADDPTEGLRKILESISQSRFGSFLVVLKRFGPGNRFLSFPRPGYTLALDFPMSGNDLLDFLDSLDRLVVEAGGRIYLAKDARLKPQYCPTMYPELPEWLEIKQRVDPENRFTSDLGRRLGLVGAEP